MKKGKYVLTVDLDVDLDDVERVAFKFMQGDRSLLFVYPSANAVRVENSINLVWTAEDTFRFDGGRRVKMDTLIKLTDAGNNPETEVTSFLLRDTLFTLEEVEAYG